MSNLIDLPNGNAIADLPLHEVAPEPASLAVRVVTLITIVVPLLSVVAVPLFVWGWGFGWTDFGLLLGMYVLTSLGITVGFHRLFVHRSFEAHTWVKFMWAIFGSMAMQGSLFQWVALHRRHHQHSDTPEDPHSPQHKGDGVFGTLRGFWHAHIGWLFESEPPRLERYIADLTAKHEFRAVSRLFPLWVILGFVIPAVLGGVLTMSWNGVWTGLVWGGLVRLFLVHHVTWSVNSSCHLWGLHPYKSNDQSRNNFLFGILALGEGWHNNHHAFPTSARHGLHWWQIDVSYYVIRTMVFLGLAWNLKVPSKRAQEKMRIDS